MTVNRRLFKSHGYYLQHAKEVCMVARKNPTQQELQQQQQSQPPPGWQQQMVQQHAGRQVQPPVGQISSSSSSWRQGVGGGGMGGVSSDIIFSERRGQSQKPEEIYELIESLVPNGEQLMFVMGPVVYCAGGGGGVRGHSAFATLSRNSKCCCSVLSTLKFIAAANRAANCIGMPVQRSVLLHICMCCTCWQFETCGCASEQSACAAAACTCLFSGKYLEIFARKNNLRNYWVSIGNEVTGTGLPEGDMQVGTATMDSQTLHV